MLENICIKQQNSTNNNFDQRKQHFFTSAIVSETKWFDMFSRLATDSNDFVTDVISPSVSVSLALEGSLVMFTKCSRALTTSFSDDSFLSCVTCVIDKESNVIEFAFNTAITVEIYI